MTMAAKLSFTLNAEKILAKLHRGACMTYPHMLFFNTGVLNDADIKPEQVDSSDIGFDIVENGRYEIGLVIDEKA